MIHGCLPTVSHKFSIYSKNEKHIAVFPKQKIIEVDNVEDNNEDINQFKEMPLFTNLENIKNIEKYFDKNLMPIYVKRWQWKICLKIMFHILY
jgi:hypothetical protein